MRAEHPKKITKKAQAKKAQKSQEKPKKDKLPKILYAVHINGSGMTPVEKCELLEKDDEDESVDDLMEDLANGPIWRNDARIFDVRKPGLDIDGCGLTIIFSSTDKEEVESFHLGARCVYHVLFHAAKEGGRFSKKELKKLGTGISQNE